MNGPQHYAEAERLISVARDRFGDHYADRPTPPLLLAEAQVHATLALVAARIEGMYNVGPEIGTDGARTDLRAEWIDAVSQ